MTSPEPVPVPESEARLRAQGLTTAYDRRVVSADLDVVVPDGEFTVIIGPNACGKSTLLRHLARLQRPAAGSVVLDGQDIQSMRARDVATRLGLLPQSALNPAGISVLDLVTRGRYPHQTFVSRWSREDEAAVAAALTATAMTELAERPVDELSGGQRQRAWVAMVLAQESPILLLDEPTTFLDISHQISLLDLFADLNQDSGRTLVAVLHDINHAARYAGHLVAMKDGRIVAEGTPADILTAGLIGEVFGIEALVVDDPANGGPLIVPRHGSRARRSTSDPARHPAPGLTQPLDSPRH